MTDGPAHAHVTNQFISVSTKGGKRKKIEAVRPDHGGAILIPSSIDGPTHPTYYKSVTTKGGKRLRIEAARPDIPSSTDGPAHPPTSNIHLPPAANTMAASDDIALPPPATQEETTPVAPRSPQQTVGHPQNVIQPAKGVRWADGPFVNDVRFVPRHEEGRSDCKAIRAVVDDNYSLLSNAQGAFKDLLLVYNRFKTENPHRFRSWSDFEERLTECKLFEQGIDMLFLEMKIMAEFDPSPALRIVRETWEDAAFVDAEEIKEAAVEPIREDAETMPLVQAEVNAPTEVVAVEHSDISESEADAKASPPPKKNESKAEAGPPPENKNHCALATLPMDKKTSSKRRHSCSESDSEAKADHPATKRIRRSAIQGNDDWQCNYSDSSEEEEEEDELLGINLIPDENAAATKIQSFFRGYCDRTMKPRPKPRVVLDAATADATADENYDFESVNFEVAGNTTEDDTVDQIIQEEEQEEIEENTAAALLLVQMKDQDSIRYSSASALDSNDEESNDFGAADDDGDDDTTAEKFSSSSSSSSSHAMEEEEVSSSSEEMVVELPIPVQEEIVEEDASTVATPPTRRKRSLKRLVANLHCGLNGLYWITATTRRVRLQSGLDGPYWTSATTRRVISKRK